MKTKILALASHLGIDVITFNNVDYANVTLEDFNEESGSNYEDVESIDEDNKVFLKWLEDNGSLLEDELIQSNYDSNSFEYGSSEYLVCTDDEADDLWEEDLDNYIEECILHELPEQYRNYFDDGAWKSDARMDGRGHSLNRYDGCEYEVDGFYIYQTN